MKKMIFWKRVAVFTVSFVFFQFFDGFANAATIQNLSVQPDGENVIIQWDHLSDSTLREADGYALQWGDSVLKVRNDKIPRQYLGKSQNTLLIRARTFDRDTVYYFRVQTWRKIDDRRRVLENGSKILKWKWPFSGEIETEIVEPNDVLLEIPESNTSPSSGSKVCKFGNVVAKKFDSSAIFRWSSPGNCAKSEIGMILIDISTSSNFDSILKSVKVAKNIRSLKVIGLSPETKYFVRGFFVKNNKTFGKSPTTSFKTLPALTEKQKAKIERLKKRGVVHDSAEFTVKIESSPDSASNSTAKNEDNSDIFGDSSTSDVNIRSRISEIQKKIRKLKSELRKLQAKLSKTGKKVKKTAKKFKKETRKIKKRISKKRSKLRDRIRAKLNKKRKKR